MAVNSLGQEAWSSMPESIKKETQEGTTVSGIVTALLGIASPFLFPYAGDEKQTKIDIRKEVTCDGERSVTS